MSIAAKYRVDISYDTVPIGWQVSEKSRCQKNDVKDYLQKN